MSAFRVQVETTHPDRWTDVVADTRMQAAEHGANTLATEEQRKDFYASGRMRVHVASADGDTYPSGAPRFCKTIPFETAKAQKAG